MKSIALVWILQLASANAFFYHGKSIEFSPPTELRNNSYFGFSTTYDNYNRKLIISAPTANENGIVYECAISTQKCSELHLNITRYAPSTYKHNYWFGATVKAGSTFLVACAPSITKSAYGAATMLGQCYRRNKDRISFDTELKTRLNHSSIERVESAMETLGWSLDIGDKDSLIVGGPGMYRNTGLAAILKNSRSSFLSLERIQDIKASFNFGYSVATGYFITQNSLWYSVGSTYGNNGYGGVYFYYHRNKILGPYTLKKGADHDKVGSMYGAVLCAANIKQSKNNKATDLLVGAPTYATHLTYNAGAVYVYIYQSNGRPPQYKRKITLHKSGSYFGSAILKVGDLNGDGQDEIAIAAPHEDDVGAVYLYSGAQLAGNKSEKSLTYLQRISRSGYQSFGLSLSVLHDHDNNGCNELVISAPYEDRTFVYSCMAAITITKITAEFPNLQKRDHDQKHFNFTVCIHVQYPHKPSEIIADISTDVALNHMHAKLSHPNNGSVFTFSTSLRDKSIKYCREVEFILPLDGNYGTQIGYDIATRLLNNPMELSFDSTRVVLSDNSVLSNNGGVWAADCAGDKECNPVLHLNITSNISKPFIVGSKDKETFRLDILNTGEVAYNPCIQVKLTNVTLYRSPTDCTEVKDHDGEYECTCRKPLKTTQIWTINDIEVNLKALTSRHANFKLDVKLFDECKTNRTKSEAYVVPLQSHYEGIDIKSITNIGDVINMNEKDLHDGKHFEHTYTITNNGMTNFENLITEIKVIKEKFMRYPEEPVTCLIEDKHKENRRTICNTKYRDESKLIANCMVKYLPKTHFFKVMVSMEIQPNYLKYDRLLNENVTQTSQLTLQIDSYERRENLTTTIQIQETAVALWIIILSVIVGILLVIMLIVALSMCGCLTRQKRKELINLKEKIKRDSNPQNQRQILIQEEEVVG